jgi:hypothetical protein
MRWRDLKKFDDQNRCAWTIKIDVRVGVNRRLTPTGEVVYPITDVENQNPLGTSYMMSGEKTVYLISVCGM